MGSKTNRISLQAGLAGLDRRVQHQKRSHLFHLRRQLEPILPFLLYIKDRRQDHTLTSSVSKGHWSRLYCSCSTSRMGPHTKTFSPLPSPKAIGAGSTVPVLHQGWGHTQKRSHLFRLQRPLELALLFLFYIKDGPTHKNVLTRSASGGCWTRFHPSCPTSRMGTTLSPVPSPEATGSSSIVPVLHQGPGHARCSHLFHLRRRLEPVLLFLPYIKDGATHNKTFSPVPPLKAARPSSTLPAL